jgi:hypothetical protein
MWRMPNPTHVMPPSSWVMNANISWSGSVTHITSQIRRMCKGRAVDHELTEFRVPLPSPVLTHEWEAQHPRTQPVDALTRVRSDRRTTALGSPPSPSHHHRNIRTANASNNKRSRLKRVHHCALRWGALKVAGVSGFRWLGFDVAVVFEDTESGERDLLSTSRLRHGGGMNDDDGFLFPSSRPGTCRTAIDRRNSMGIHVYGVTVGTLQDASRAARTVDHAVTLIDDFAHMVVLVDQRGHIVIRSESPPNCPN